MCATNRLRFRHHKRGVSSTNKAAASVTASSCCFSFMANITLPNNLGALDLAAVDIIRDRERGVPRCVQWKALVQYCTG